MGAPPQLLELLRTQIADERALAAVAAVPRELFVAPELRAQAWENEPLPIGRGQTISQPLVVARMLECLRVAPGDRVLDVGTGSGWHAALLGVLGGEVWTIERHAELAETAVAALEAAGIGNVRVHVGDGRLGLPEAAPYDAINVAAAASAGVPPALIEQLAPGGRLVAPVGDARQHLVAIDRAADGSLSERRLEGVRFVPLV
ncbi:MAG TPA: protein-L-isoaspartate(D-aspartate) O-methyltransferase [Solirubrobacteraceae bacterium]